MIEYIMMFLEIIFFYCAVSKNDKEAILDVLNNEIITSWYSHIDIKDLYNPESRQDLKFCGFKLLNNKTVNFNPLNKIYKNSLINRFIMIVKFKKSLWEYWYKCF